jgi:hypothetical protein
VVAGVGPWASGVSDAGADEPFDVVDGHLSHQRSGSSGSGAVSSNAVSRFASRRFC